MTIPVGIDLGTTFSTIAILNKYGKSEIIANSEGERLTPSAVMMTSDGSVVVGTIAKHSAITEPNNVVEFVKRQMGNPDFLFLHGNQEYGVEELSAFILKKLKQDAEMLVGEEVRDVVITVPAYFDDIRRQATLNAGKIAGLNVLKIINEPTAAALSYGLNVSKRQCVMVYDLGGGTFDVTIMQVNQGEIRVLATDGDHMLGGKDFDERIMLHVNDIFTQEFGVDLFDDLEVQHDLRQRAEAAKKILSARSSAKISMSAHGYRKTIEITRDQFAEMTADLLERTELLIDSVMMSSSLSWGDIDSVLLVGGSTRMPAVQDLVRRLSGQEPNQSVNPDEAVALGAAMQAGILMVQGGNSLILQTEAGRRLSTTNVIDVTSHSFGVQVLDHYSNQLHNQIMIPKNSTIPSERVEEFYTVEHNQRSVDFVLLQGEDPNPDNCAVIGRTELQFDRPKPMNYPLRVIYSYDANMMIHASIEDVQTGYKAVLDIQLTGRLTEGEIASKRRSFDIIDVE
jgi:molecular chaperone DnaK